MKNDREIIRICIWIIVLVFVVSCGSNGSYYSDISTSTVNPSEITISPESSSTTIQEELQPEGSLVLACSGGLFQYSFEDKVFLVLDKDETMVFSFVDWNQDGIFYTRPTFNSDKTIFTGEQQKLNKIFWIKTGTTIPKQLTHDDYWDFQLDVSPQPGYVVYVSDRPEPDFVNRYKLVLLNTYDSKETILFDGPNQFIPTLSPLGDKIAFLDIPIRFEEPVKLFFYDLHFNTQTQLIPEKEVLRTGIVWSQDQQYITAGVKENEDFSIVFINTDTGSIDKIIPLENEPGYFAWSPDGSKLVFETREYLITNEVSVQLLLYDNSLGKITNLHSGGIDGKFSRYHVLWSPSSDAVAFFVDNEDRTSGQKIIIKDINTSNQLIIETECLPVRSATWIEPQ